MHMRKMLALAIASLGLVLTPVAGADDPTETVQGTTNDPPCHLFWYSTSPPAYRLNLDCLESSSPVTAPPLVQQGP